MKRILLVGLGWLGYTTAIADEFRRLGYDVKFYEVMPRAFADKTIRRLSPAYYRTRLDSYHEGIISAEAASRYDIIVFIQAHQFSLDNIWKLRIGHPEAEFILYNWDSTHVHDYTKHMKYFDRVLTFDLEDSEKLGIIYLPLFCTREFQKYSEVLPEEDGIYFVGHIYSVARYIAVKAFESYCAENDIRFHHKMVCNPYQYLRLLKSGILPTGVSTRSIGGPELASMVLKSTAVFDIANHVQTGLTMRVIENVCMNRKVITNNKFIKQESFYSDKRIFVFEGQDYSGVKEFLSVPLSETPVNLEEYYIQSFVQKLIGGTQQRRENFGDYQNENHR